MAENHMTFIEQAHPNAATIVGLREVADWLEAHPELPEPYYAAVSFRSSYEEKNAREELTTLAAALGDRATEQYSFSGEVEIAARFENVRVSGAAKVQHLRDEPPRSVEYEPILKSVPE